MSTECGVVKKAVILGLPNSGKSQLFTRLTGRYAAVANAPLTTIELNSAPLAIGSGNYNIIDTPGIQDLFTSINNSEPIREAIFSLRPDVLIMCIDANRVKQSLALALEVQSLEIPMVVALNLLDDARKRGIYVDATQISGSLGVPVILQQGTPEDAVLLAKTLDGAKKAKAKGLVYGASLRKSFKQIESGLPPDFPYPRAAALHLLMGGTAAAVYFDNCDNATLATLTANVESALGQIKGDALSIIHNTWNRWIDVSSGKFIQLRKNRDQDILQVVARLCRSMIFGPPILMLIIYVTFLLVVDVANSISEWMNNLLWLPTRDALAGWLPPGLVSDFLIGDYGIVSMGLANALLTVLPILSVFYLVFNTLEDIGYLPNLSVLTRRILGKLGLGGNAVMPLLLGFGCKTMATLTTKTIISLRERYITVFLIAFAIPCAGQMGLNMSVIGRMGWSAFVISSLTLVSVELAAGLALNKFLARKDSLDSFILELPPIRFPKPVEVLKKTYRKIYSFLHESLLVFVYAALALFLMEKTGLLEVIKTFLDPVVYGLLGLPRAMTDAIMLLLARQEAAAAVIIDLIRKGQLGYKQTIVAVMLTTMFIPCLANVMAIKKLLGTRCAVTIFMSVNVVGLAAAIALNMVLTAFGY